MVVDRLPQPAQEAKLSLNALVRPLERLLGWSGEHREQARRIGAVLLHQRLRIHAVVLRLRHRAEAAVFDRRVILERYRADARAAGIEFWLNFGRIQKLLSAISAG